MAKKNTQNAVKEAVTERIAIDKMELFRKEKENLPMTYAEIEALRREKTKELSNQILRVFGLFTIIAIIVFAVGTFLYPYSVFNVFGGGDRFWDCWNHLQFHAGTVMRGEERIDSDGWITLESLYTVAFQPGVNGKINFIALGAWSIVPLCTIGLVGTILISAYLLAYNIRDLIAVIKHFLKKTGTAVSEVAISAVESVETAVDSEKKKPIKKAPAPKKRKEDPEEEKKDGDEIALPEIDVDSLVEEHSAPKDEKKKDESGDETGGLSTEQLDALLRGESIE